LTGETRFAGRLLGTLAIGWMAFIAYGSLVPFDFHTRDADDARTAFRWAMTDRWWFESRSDAIANVMLGVPLGFALVGFLRIGRTGFVGDMLVGGLVVPACAAYAAVVEFAQLYVPERTTAGSDVLCQGLGAAIGVFAWIAVGRLLMKQADDIWSGTRAAGKLLIAYLLLLAFIQTLPLDLSASPRDLYRKLRDDVVFVPFSEVNGANAIERGARLLQVCGLFLPVGLLMRATGRWNFGWMLVAVSTEGLQLIVKSRVPSATDAVIGAFGVSLGWWLGGRTIRGSLPPPASVLLYGAWLLGMLAISWQPFDKRAVPLPFDWIPGLPLESGHPLFALEEMLTKLALFGLGGLLARSPARAALGGLIVGGLCEWGQTIIGSHTPCITDVLLGGLGMALGSRIRSLTV